MNKMHSGELDREISDRRNVHIEYLNKDLNKNGFQKTPG